MIDPLERWAEFGEKPDFAGLLSFAGLPYTEDPIELAGADVAIIGAPMDDLVSDRSGTRFGPRAIRAAGCPPGPHLDAGADALRGGKLKVVDFGDAPVIPGAPLRSHEAIAETVANALRAGTVPVVLGGDHSIAEPDISACADVHGPVGLVHFDAHTDTGRQVFGTDFSHGTAMYRLVASGQVDPRRYVQIGLRGYWPGPEVFEWQREEGITWHTMAAVRRQGIEAVVAETVERLGGDTAGPVYLSVDVDVLDPAFAPGTGTPEPGGMTAADLLWACRELARRLPLVGAEVVEVLPERIGSRDITALVAERLVRETITGIALRRYG